MWRNAPAAVEQADLRWRAAPRGVSLRAGQWMPSGNRRAAIADPHMNRMCRLDRPADALARGKPVKKVLQ